MIPLSKKCKSCLSELPLSVFGRQKKKPFIRAVCNPCRRLAWKEYKEKNPDRVRAITRKAFAKHRSQNLDVIRKRSREYAKKKYRQNPVAVIARTAERYAKKRMAVPSWINRFFVSEIYSLARFRSAVTGIAWNVDHIVPLQSKTVCGLHWEGNLRVIPAAENRTKSNLSWPGMP